MYLWIILGVSAIAIVAGIIGNHYDDCSNWFMAIILGACVFLIAGMVLLILSIQCPQEIAVFEQQKSYIENHVSKNDIEDAALTAKKVELNDWLYNAQYQYEHFKGWNLYPDSIQDLQEIK